MNTCRDCAQPVKARGLCNMHYQRERRGHTLDAAPRARLAPDKGCTADECPRPYYAKGMCSMHYYRAKQAEYMADPVKAAQIRERAAERERARRGNRPPRPRLTDEERNARDAERRRIKRQQKEEARRERERLADERHQAKQLAEAVRKAKRPKTAGRDPMFPIPFFIEEPRPEDAAKVRAVIARMAPEGERAELEQMLGVAA